MATNGTLLIVDDEPDMLSLLKRIIAPEVDWKILSSTSAKQALDIMSKATVDLVLLDIKMPDMDGMELLEILKQKDNGPTVIMMTAYGVIELAVDSIRKGAYDFLTKPLDNTRLLITLKKAMEYHLLVRENRDLQRLIKGKDSFCGMIGASPAMKKVFETITMVSKADTTVLITGESGTGKELVARAIHQLSSRADKPFVIVNCPTLPENILEAELFGHTKGAFTDAKYEKKGMFQEADGGTIFLDEIGEIPPPIQSKLLRVLQEKEIRPLGSSRSFKVDVKVLASTNRNLEEEIKAGRFREDLYYRLNVINIELPPLRQRTEDIPLLAEYFVKKYSKELGKEGARFAPGVVEELCRRPWRGNVRELENCVKRGIILSRSEVLTIGDITCEQAEECLVTSDLMHLPYHEAKQKVLAAFNHEYLTKALRENQGNVTRTAKQCRLERQVLQQILKRYNIKAEEFRVLAG